MTRLKTEHLSCWNFVKIVKNAKNTKWWTYKHWKKDFDNKKAFCPKCGKICFDID